jgi:hypothetical protein
VFVTQRPLDVLDPWGTRIEVDCRDVDTDARDVLLPSEPVLPQTIGGLEQASSLGAREGCEGRKKRRRAASAYLDNGNDGSQADEEVDFEAADPEVLREDRVAARDEEIACQRLGSLAYLRATKS